MSRQKINRITFVLLLLGFGSALVIHLTAKPGFVDPMLGDPLDNKKYLYELKRIGGEANVLSAEFQEWFAAQWQGELLARTIAILTLGVTCVFRFVATPPGPAEAPAEEKTPPPGPAA